MRPALFAAKFSRLFAILLLTLIFFVSIYINFFLYGLFSLKYHSLLIVLGQIPILILLAALLMVLIFPYFRNLNKVNLALSDENTDKLKQIAYELSNSFAVKTPAIKIVEHVNPTAFTIKTGLNKYTIYITNGLLNLINENEMRVVLSHEITHIYSGFTSSFKTVNYLLFSLKLSGLLIFFMGLAGIRIELLFIWFILILPFIFIKYPFFPADLIRYIVPPNILIDFLTIPIYKLIKFNEEHIANLKLSLLAGNKDAINSMTQKLQSYPGPFADLPTKFKPLYFPPTPFHSPLNTHHI